MQSKNKNDSVQLSSRYQQYCFAKRHLRGTSRPEVFPIEGGNPKTLNQIVGGGQGNRVYGIDGISCTQASQAGGQGAKTGLYAIRRSRSTQPWRKSETAPTVRNGDKDDIRAIVPEATKKGYAIAEKGDSINLSVPNSKTRRGRVGKGIAQTIDTGMQQHTIDNCKIRRLTPKECERLQGFPDRWTAEGTEGKISDTQRYRQCGNAVSVPVVKAIVEKLVAL